MSDELRDNRRTHERGYGLSRKGVDKKLHNRRAKRALAKELRVRRPPEREPVDMEPDPEPENLLWDPNEDDALTDEELRDLCS